MVRINIIQPKYLLDQHLLAEWNETQMLYGTIQKHPHISWMPERYKLGKGHINFFKNKALYLMKRMVHIREELVTRGYSPNTIANLGDIYFNHNSSNPIDMSTQIDWVPKEEDFKIIGERLRQKHAMQPNWYTIMAGV